MTQSPFEIPQQMRDLAQKNIEQASAVYGQFMDAMTQACEIRFKADTGYGGKRTPAQ